MPINARNKGKAGELEFCQRFQAFFPETLKRNLLQSREGGADISGCNPFQIEVKRCEKLEHDKWWRQVQAAVTSAMEIPVVAFRQNKKTWRFQFPANLLGIEHQGYVIGNEDQFIQLVFRFVKEPLQKSNEAIGGDEEEHF